MTANKEDMINNFAFVLAEASSPRKIILFGSLARGDHAPDSDYALLVIIYRFEARADKTALTDEWALKGLYL
jgi:predicted nucleotidyltransferase